MGHYIAIDVGGTQIRAACYSGQGLIPLTIDRASTHCPDGSALECLINLIIKIWPHEQDVEALCIAIPGPVNPYSGVIIEAPNIPGWEDLPIRRYLEDRFKVPVAIGNDANLAAIGEWKYGSGQGHHNLIYITVSTGIGGGVIVDDQLLLGARGLAAELGHVTILPDGPMCSCGCRGHLEALASGTAIASWAEEEMSRGIHSSLAFDKPLTAKKVGAAAQKGDELAKAALTRAGTFLGLTLANYLHIFNPTVIVIGGGVSQAGPLLLEPMRSAMQQHVMSPHYMEDLKITRAALGDEAGLVGALALARTYNKS